MRLNDHLGNYMVLYLHLSIWTRWLEEKSRLREGKGAKGAIREIHNVGGLLGIGLSGCEWLMRIRSYEGTASNRVTEISPMHDNTQG